MKCFFHCAFALLLTIAGKAFGQGNYDYPAVQGQFEAGGALITRGSSHFLDNGYTVGAGIVIHPGHGPFAIRPTFDYIHLNASRESIDEARAFTGTDFRGGAADIYHVRVNGVFERPIAPFARAYITAGVGFAYERLTQSVYVAEVGPTQGEDFFVALGTAVGEAFAHSFSEIIPAFTYNAAVGLDFSRGGVESFFIEAGYEHIAHGPTPVPTAFIPIRVGMRF